MSDAASGTGPSPEPGRIAVGLSGGVDSSVAAALLRDAGHQVIGVTLKLRDDPESRDLPAADEGLDRARAVAAQLGIPHQVVDCTREFDESVLRPAWEEYARGRTPSPCLLCNERIKFGALLSWVRQEGATRLATGHYARVEQLAGEGPSLWRGSDPNKDQSYFLAGLSREQLAAVVFPLGGLTKLAVRERARALGLSTAETRESQDACLVGPDQAFAETLRVRYGGECRPGPILDDEGGALGRHPGIHHFTVGQRRGIGVAGAGRRWVRAIRPEDGALVVTDDEAALCGRRLVATGLSWLGVDPPRPGLTCMVQVRYRHLAEAARLEACGADSIEVVFERPVRAITPGQAAVFYDGARVLGRGWIEAGG